MPGRNGFAIGHVSAITPGDKTAVFAFAILKQHGSDSFADVIIRKLLPRLNGALESLVKVRVIIQALAIIVELHGGIDLCAYLPERAFLPAFRQVFFYIVLLPFGQAVKKGEFINLFRRCHLAFVDIAAQVIRLRDVVFRLFIAALFKLFSELGFPFFRQAHPPELLNFRKLLGVIQPLLRRQRFKTPCKVGIQGFLPHSVNFPVSVPHGLELRPHVLVRNFRNGGCENPVLLFAVQPLELIMHSIVGRGDVLFALCFLLRLQTFHLLLKKRLAFQWRSTAQARSGRSVFLHTRVEEKRFLCG